MPAQTTPAQLDRKVTFRQRSLVGEVRRGSYADVVTRSARVTPLTGGEEVQAQRFAGRQPVIIRVRYDQVTKTIDNAWRARDARDATTSWDVSSKIVSEDRRWIEVQAVQRLSGDDDE